jgi:ABC-type polysaccharide/polyol phosphate export permease
MQVVADDIQLEQSALNKEIKLTYLDITQAISAYYIWLICGWQDIKQRYRRSVLGPIWLTLSTGVMVFSIGLLYPKLFKQDISSYLPFLSISLVTWGFISSLLTEGCSSFINAEHLIKQMKLPYTIHVLRQVWRNLIIFAHNLIIVAIVMIALQKAMSWSILLFPFATFVVDFMCTFSRFSSDYSKHDTSRIFLNSYYVGSYFIR